MNQPIQRKRVVDDEAGAGRCDGRRPVVFTRWTAALRQRLWRGLRQVWLWVCRRRPALRLQVGACCRVAAHRDLNPDRCYADARSGLFAVVDGKSRQAAGEPASQLIIEVLAEQLGPVLRQPDLESGAIAQRLRRTFGIANQELLALAARRPAWREMGAAATVAVVRHRQLWLLGVGGGGVLLLRDGRLQMLGASDNALQRMVASGALTPQEAAHHPMRHLSVARTLGTPGVERALRVQQHPVRRGDRLLVTTDGLLRSVTAEETAAVLATHDDAREATGALVDRALQSGASDSITCIVIDVMRR